MFHERRRPFFYEAYGDASAPERLKARKSKAPPAE